MKKRFILFILTLTLVMPTCVFAQEEEQALPINTVLSDSLTITPYSLDYFYTTVQKIYNANEYEFPPKTCWYQVYSSGSWYSGTLNTVSENYSYTTNVWIVVYGGYVYK